MRLRRTEWDSDVLVELIDLTHLVALSYAVGH